MRKVLRALLEHRLYAKLSKCAFNRSEVTFLGFIVNQRGIQMEQSRIDAITEWSKSESAKDILVFLGFAGFYRRFVKGFSQIAAPLTDLTRGAKKGQIRPPFVFGKEAREAFETLKRMFITAPIRSKYYWPGMVNEIAEYVRTCPECQRVRVHHHKPYGELVSIPPGGVASFHTVTMDFITDLPPARDPYTGNTCDAILVLMDKLMKHATYIATTKELKADGLADIMWREFVSLRGMMRNLISNRGSLFISKFWTTLC